MKVLFAIALLVLAHTAAAATDASLVMNAAEAMSNDVKTMAMNVVKHLNRHSHIAQIDVDPSDLTCFDLTALSNPKAILTGEVQLDCSKCVQSDMAKICNVMNDAFACLRLPECKELFEAMPDSPSAEPSEEAMIEATCANPKCLNNYGSIMKRAMSCLKNKLSDAFPGADMSEMDAVADAPAIEDAKKYLKPMCARRPGSGTTCYKEVKNFMNSGVENMEDAAACRLGHSIGCCMGEMVSILELQDQSTDEAEAQLKACNIDSSVKCPDPLVSKPVTSFTLTLDGVTEEAFNALDSSKKAQLRGLLAEALSAELGTNTAATSIGDITFNADGDAAIEVDVVDANAADIQPKLADGVAFSESQNSEMKLLTGSNDSFTVKSTTTATTATQGGDANAAYGVMPSLMAVAVMVFTVLAM